MKQTFYDRICDLSFGWIFAVCLVIAIAICTAIMTPVILIGTSINNAKIQSGIENYNNGICKECGEELEYRGSSRDNHSRYDYYICPNGHVVEVYRGSGN